MQSDSKLLVREWNAKNVSAIELKATEQYFLSFGAAIVVLTFASMNEILNFDHFQNWKLLTIAYLWCCLILSSLLIKMLVAFARFKRELIILIF